MARLFFSQAIFGATVIVLSNHLTKLLEFSTPLDYVVQIAGIFIQTALTRFSPMEFLYFFMEAYACYLYVKEKMDLLLKKFNEPLLSIHLVPEYLRLMKLIKHVNPLMKIISLANGLTTIPFAASVIVTAITYPENDLQLIIKYSYVIPTVIFSVRGVVMTIVLAQIDRRSKILYKLLASRIARGQITGFISVKQLMLIMDDLAGRKNHLVMREHSGSPSTQMDVMMNVLTICQFVMLLMEFSFMLVF